MILALALLGACEKQAEVPIAPELHGWTEESGLVVSGLAEVASLWKQNQREAARKLAEQVYTDRYEPRLERAAMQIDADEARHTEYAFGLLLVELETRAGRDHVDERIRTIDERVEALAVVAAQRFPPPGQVGAPVAEAPAGGSRPIVPPVAPAWDDPPEAK